MEANEKDIGPNGEIISAESDKWPNGTREFSVTNISNIKNN